MKRLLCTLFMACIAFMAAAQNEQDFAERYMKLYGEGTSLQCTTVSPLMIERILQLPASRDLGHVKEVLEQLKSIRIVSSSEPDRNSGFYEKASKLAKDNPRRYKPHSEQEGSSIYLRKRGKLIVELVLLNQGEGGNFTIVDLTGNMTEAFLRELTNI